MVNVPLFSELTTACYLVFLDPDELDRLLRLLNSRRPRRVRLPGRVDSASIPQGPHIAVPARVCSDVGIHFG